MKQTENKFNINNIHSVALNLLNGQVKIILNHWNCMPIIWYIC